MQEYREKSQKNLSTIEAIQGINLRGSVSERICLFTFEYSCNPKDGFAYKKFHIMQENEKKVAQLKQQVAGLQNQIEDLKLYKKTISFLNSVYEQKINYLEKHYPNLVSSASWDFDETKRVQAFSSISLFDLKILN